MKECLRLLDETNDCCAVDMSFPNWVHAPCDYKDDPFSHSFFDIICILVPPRFITKVALTILALHRPTEFNLQIKIPRRTTPKTMSKIYAYPSTENVVAFNCKSIQVLPPKANARVGKKRQQWFLQLLSGQVRLFCPL